MTQEALKKMYQLLLTEPHSPTVCAQLERIAREALAEHAMSEVQRIGQEIEQERKWVELTDADRFRLWLKTDSEDDDRYAFAKAIEQALKEQNT